MDGFRFDEEKAVNVVLLILQKVGKINRHKLAKILYFADQNHLVKYGRPILGDNYIAMKHGPVPSAVYDGIKAIDDFRYNFDFFRSNLASQGIFIHPKADPDLDELSQSEIDCIIDSISDNIDLTFDQLVQKSHSLAWEKACKNGKMNIKAIAEEGGAKKEVLDRVLENVHIAHLAEHYGLTR